MWRFRGAPIFSPEVPKYLFEGVLGHPEFSVQRSQNTYLKGFGTSGRKIGVRQKRHIQPRRIQPPILGPLKFWKACPEVPQFSPSLSRSSPVTSRELLSLWIARAFQRCPRSSPDLPRSNRTASTARLWESQHPSERPRRLLLSLGGAIQTLAWVRSGPIQVPSRERRAPVQIRHVFCFAAFRSHPGPDVGAILARPGPERSFQDRPGRAETDFLVTSEPSVNPPLFARNFQTRFLFFGGGDPIQTPPQTPAPAGSFSSTKKSSSDVPE